MRIYAPCDVKLSVVAGSDIPDAAEIGMLNNKFQVEVARLKASNLPESVIASILLRA